MRVYRPDGKGRHPVVIFSHGDGGNGKAAAYLSEYLAGHGFIAIHPTHHGSDSSTSKEALATTAIDPKQWLARVGDVRFILDSLPKLAPDADPSRVAMAGHSLGALTAMLLAGARPGRLGDRPSPYLDDRLKAFVPMSAQGLSEEFFDAHSWDGIRKPVLYVTGSEDKTEVHPTSRSL